MRKLFIILSLSWLSISLFGQTKQIDKLREQQKIVLEDIKNTNKLFLDVKKQTTTILSRINLINKQIDSRKKMMALQNQEVNELTRELTRIEDEIKKLGEDLKHKQDSYAKAVRTLQSNRSSQSEMFFILSGKSFGESLRRMQYIKEYSKWRRTQANDIKKKNEELSKKRVEFEKSKQERVAALKALEAEQQKLREEEGIRQKEIKESRGKQNELQKSLRSKEQQAKKMNAEIERMIREEIARQEREAAARRKAEQDKRDAEARARGEEPAPRVEKPKAESTETFALSKNFVSNKGKLPMPVAGTASVVSKFGVNKHSEWNISTNSNGIDIQAQRGASIRSVFEGEVSKVAYFPGMNTCVIVRHGDYYTFYANIYDLHVKVGDKLKTGQSIGTIFTDPDTGVASMHFQLWHKTNKLNPAPWLRQ